MSVRACRPKLFKLFKHLCLSLVSGVPHFFFRTTPLCRSVWGGTSLHVEYYKGLDSQRLTRLDNRQQWFARYIGVVLLCKLPAGTTKLTASLVECYTDWANSLKDVCSLRAYLLRDLNTQHNLAVTTTWYPHPNLFGRLTHLGSSQWYGNKYFQNQRNGRPTWSSG